MLLDEFMTKNAESFSFSRLQSCRFAKQVATDFNPIHDEDAKRFCVPGDLLFAYLLSHYGLNASISCHFAGMVSADVSLYCRETAEQIQICDNNDKVYLTMQRSGALTQDLNIIEPLIKDYVQFSGQNFPHILQPLMQQQQVMINPLRPLVIYESMALHFNQLPTAAVHISLASSSLKVEGKRGSVLLKFTVSQQGQAIGAGEKRMILSNLQPYDKQIMQQMVDDYNKRKALYI